MTGHRSAPLNVRAFADSRRARLVDVLNDLALDGVLMTDAREIMHFTGAAPVSPGPSCLLVRSNGETTLITGAGDSLHHVDTIRQYAWHAGGTIFASLLPALVAEAQTSLGIGRARLGMQCESAPAGLLSAFDHASWVPLDAELIELQRNKDAIALSGISRAIAANLAAYSAVQQAIRPGVTELEVFAAGWKGATLNAGHKLLHDGDYRCGAINGPARDRQIEPGELYIVDAWTQCDGYWSDLSHTFPVSPTPTLLQQELLAHVASVHERIRHLLVAGTRGDDLWRAIDAALREHPALAHTGLAHHGGHGIGTRIHEPPDINPGVSDTLRDGDVICIEPGGYTPLARAGVRIEQMYRITDAGPVCLSEP